MIKELASEPVAETIKDRQEQGKAILDLINSPEFQQEHKGFKLPKGVETALGIGSKNGIITAQNTLGNLITEESRMEEARARAPRVQSAQADEQKEQSRRASENAQQGLMESTNKPIAKKKTLATQQKTSRAKSNPLKKTTVTFLIYCPNQTNLTTLNQLMCKLNLKSRHKLNRRVNRQNQNADAVRKSPLFIRNLRLTRTRISVLILTTSLKLPKTPTPCSSICGKWR